MAKRRPKRSSRARIRLKRVYDQPSKDDGVRVLVERLWPRGLTKQAARIDAWLKEIAPSTELRKWFGHDVAKWSEFRRRYCQELVENVEPVARLIEMCRGGTVTLVFAARNSEHNSAVVLREFLDQRSADTGGRNPSKRG